MSALSGLPEALEQVKINLTDPLLNIMENERVLDVCPYPHSSLELIGEESWRSRRLLAWDQR